MGMQPYRTESLDLAAWLMAHGYVLADVVMLTTHRHRYAFDDPDDKAKGDAIKFANSMAADVLDTRKRLITLSRSGRYDRPTKKG